MSDQFIFLRDSGVLKKLNIDEIVVIEGADNYIKVHALDCTYTVRATLEATQSRLPAKKFLRVHRCYIVSVNFIVKISKETLLLFDQETEIPISKQHYPEIIKQIVILDAVKSEKKNKRWSRKNPPSLKI